MSKHTPGPWEVAIWSKHTANAGHPSGVYQSEECEGVNICEFRPDEVPLEEQRANARLIAAAPELLERLERTLNSLLYAKERLVARKEFDAARVVRNTIHSNRIAITKAKGG